MGQGPDRRSVLIGAALLPLAACTADPAPSPPAPADPDDLLRRAAVQRERELLEQYDAVLGALPALAARLAPVRAEHAVHLGALLPDEPVVGPSASASPSTPSSPPPSASPPAAPDPASALAGLSAAEAAAGAAHSGAALQAAPELAGLLACLAASEASHRVVLA